MNPYTKLNFTVAGTPISTPPPGDRATGLVHALKLGCDGMEIEWVQQVKIASKVAEAIREIKTETGCALTAHGPYYINLNSPDDKVVQASIERILLTARTGATCGCTSFTFHAAFIMGRNRATVHREIIRHLLNIQRTITKEKLEIRMRPELTGKPSQWGSLEELFEMSQEIPGIAPCIDWAHLYARTGGKYNTFEEFKAILRDYESTLGESELKDMHMHVGGITYSKAGEAHHVPLKESDFNYKDLLRAFKEFDLRGVVVAETPVLEEDTLLLKRAFKRIGTKKKGKR